MKLIDPNRVEEILIDCLFREGEDTESRVEAEGIIDHWGFHPQRLEEHRGEVKGMLDLLPLEFRSTEEGGGDGWSFLNACVCRDPERPELPFEEMPQWTGLHQRMDQLFSLGQGLGYVRCVLPRPIWSSLPGGMPFYVVTLGTEETDG